ncbi:response regulator [Roseateles oligotrophus]|uniref:Response regulator n=1 Tax=Roseateles oligotrophus TaxID=1769250 RepID=A0ABT2YDB6_9BURK|nr:response regulator [Roseateles oligotrophus]MCV2368046.1 response regulator [Roseateles oligotrophus]
MPADLRFLVVDGLAGVQTFARQLLEGFGLPADTIRCASDPESGLKIGLDFKPDYLISDWFPKATMSGIELYGRLKEANPGCRLALLSFEVSPQHMADAYEVGSNFLLKKPFTAAELKSTMTQALEALARERPELHARLSAIVKIAPPAPKPPRIVLPVLPVLKAGDRVKYHDKIETVQCVVVSHGELVVQLKGHQVLIPAIRLDKV